MAIKYIEGSLAVSITNSEVFFLLTPFQEYLSPDKKYAVIYEEKIEKKEIKIVPLIKGHHIKLESNMNRKYISCLITIALKQKTVRLHICFDEDEMAIICGFVYPIETFQ